MIQNKQLQEFLKRYAGDAEVIILSNDKHEIRHVGMAYDKVSNKYKIILASEVPTHCCNVCGENVHRTVDSIFAARWYCPTCDRYRHGYEISRL